MMEARTPGTRTCLKGRVGVRHATCSEASRSSLIVDICTAEGRAQTLPGPEAGMSFGAQVASVFF